MRKLNTSVELVLNNMLASNYSQLNLSVNSIKQGRFTYSGFVLVE